MAAKSKTFRRDHGFTLIELLIVVAIISILAALAMAGLLRSRITANEVGAIASMRVVATAQKLYATSCGFGAYATTFIVLGTPPGGGQAFLSADLGSSLAELDAYASLNDDRSLAHQARLSNVEDVDMAQAISQLSREHATYQAALQSYSAISKLSLFNYL